MHQCIVGGRFGIRRFRLIMKVVFIACLSSLIVRIDARGQQDTTAAADSLLLRQLERQMAPPAAAQQPAAQPRSAISTNPNISVIGDFQGRYNSALDRHLDATLNEAELSFQSVVDPYARADFFVSLAKDPSTGRFEADLEEAYLTTLDLPAGLQLKAGKFRSALGRLNPVHPHALPFADLPAAYVNFFGEEGLNDEGLSLSWLVPNPADFYQELTVEATAGPENSPSFVRSASNKYLFLAHLKNFWDLTENATLELGFTGMAGPNASSASTTIGAVDLTYKWKPLRYNTYRSLVWQSEAFFSDAANPFVADVHAWGMYSFLTWQVEKRWFVTGRFDYSQLPLSSSYEERSLSATLGWYATEFQKIELEGKTTSGNSLDRYEEAMLRWIFVIGSHGAHAY